MSKMLKFMKPQSKSVPPERLQKQKELFAFSESCFHGFPSKPSALSWDPKLSLLAIATKAGTIRVYGKPGVEFYGQHENCEAAITEICFLPGQMSLVSLCDDNSIHLWKIQQEQSKESLVKVKSSSLEGKLKKISVIMPDAECKSLLVGTEGGNIYLLDISTFTMTNDIIYLDVVMQNVPEDYKVNPGPVECIITHPTETSKILVGYQRGLIVLWDRKAPCAEQTYVTTQALESLCWNVDASEFMSCHNDGSFIVWDTNNCNKPKDGPTTVYGPFPCKPINKIAWLKSVEGYLTVFSGGMARAHYGDRNTVTAMQGEKHVTFNLTSRVIDFVVTQHLETDEPSTMIILAEEEIVFIDLTTEDWLPFQNQYLSSLHSSAVTCSTLVCNVDQKVFEKIKATGFALEDKYSKNPWPITGGNPNLPSDTSRNILVTGHEDGSVRFWDASTLCVTPLYKISTSNLFVSEDLYAETANDEDDDWPPFRKAGVFDPFSDDPRLGILKIEMCPHTGHVVIAGTAGQIIINEIVMEKREFLPECVNVNLVAEADGFLWKSHSKLEMQKEPIKFDSGIQPTVVVQFYPPASCTSLHLHSEWGLIAMGTAHGFSLFDYFTKKNLLTKSTLSANDIANTCDEGPMSRRKSLKKSLRESFRRLRKGRSHRKTKTKDSHNVQINAKSPSNEEDGMKPVERAIEARTQSGDYIGSMVRCLHLTKCYIASNQAMSATLWAGTNGGAIYVYTIFIPPSEKRMEVPLTVQLGKEIHLKHAAPVINITILDGASRPFPEPMAVKKGAANSPDNSGSHRVLISSEEQFKVFTLPQLKPYCKFKLTAHEGSRLRKIGFSQFTSVVDNNYTETCFMIVTNLGDISVFSLPGAKRQVQALYLKKENISGINSVMFTKSGEALFLVSASEIGRISLSARSITCPKGTVYDVNMAAPQQIKSPIDGVNESSPKSICSLKKLEENRESADTSLVSADITIDSIRDHMPVAVEEVKTVEKYIETPPVVSSVSTGCETTTLTESTVKEESHTTKSVTIVKTSTVVSSQAEVGSVQVVETVQSPDELPIVNGQETPNSCYLQNLSAMKETLNESKGAD